MIPDDLGSDNRVCGWAVNWLSLLTMLPARFAEVSALNSGDSMFNYCGCHYCLKLSVFS